MAGFTSEDIAYLSHGDRKIMARIFKPEGAGPFPCFINLHGGAWNNGDLADSAGLGEYLASRGVVMPSLNFRHGPDGYPTTLADINYGIRWVKAHAKGQHRPQPRRHRRPARRPSGDAGGDAAQGPRYAAIPCQGCDDPSVRGVFMMWPVINPLSRYKHAKRLVTAGDPPAWAVGMDKKHDIYWHTEAEMAEGNPMLILEKGEKVVMPPAVWLQGRPDMTHDYHDPDSNFAGNEPERFVSNYRKAGGDIEIAYFDNAARNTDVTHAPVYAFMQKHVG